MTALELRDRELLVDCIWEKVTYSEVRVPHQMKPRIPAKCYWELAEQLNDSNEMMRRYYNMYAADEEPNPEAL